MRVTASLAKFHVESWQPKERRYHHRMNDPQTAYVTPDALGTIPNMAALVARVIAVYSRAEFNSMLCLSELIGGNKTLQFKMFMKIDSQKVKNDILSLFDLPDLGDIFTEYDHCVKLLKAISNIRHRLAHGIVGIFNDRYDDFVIFNMKEIVNSVQDFQIDTVVSALKGYIVTKKELEEIIEYIEKINASLWNIYQELLDRDRQ